jgi:hypothetical protein
MKGDQYEQLQVETQKVKVRRGDFCSVVDDGPGYRPMYRSPYFGPLITK